MLAVKGAVMKHHGGKVIPEQAAKGERAENGLVQAAGKTVREYACTFISQVEEGIGEEMAKPSPMFLWILRRAAVATLGAQLARMEGQPMKG